MRDLFDDFMEELRRREAVARGEDPDSGRPGARKPDADDGPDDEPTTTASRSTTTTGDDDRSTATRRRRRGGAGERRAAAERTARRAAAAGAGVAAAARMTAAGAGRRAPAAGSGSSSASSSRIGVFLLFSFGLDLWTDALWYESVGFDAVFWTRIGARRSASLSAAFVLALVVLFGNLWLAGRLAPAADGTAAATVQSLVDRLNAAAQAADERRDRPGGRTLGSRATTARHRRRPIVFDAGDLPDLTPHRRLGPRRAGRFHRAGHRRLGVRGLGDGPALDQPRAVLADRLGHRPDLQPRHQLLPVRAAVPAPRPGRCSTPSSSARLLLVLARYLVGASRGGLVFSTPVRVHLAVLGGLFLLSVAFGYQLDKLELVVQRPRRRDRASASPTRTPSSSPTTS